MNKYKPELNEECEVLHLGAWHKCTIKAKTGQWYILDTFAGEMPFQIEQSSFRPLKSDEELAVEQMVEDSRHLDSGVHCRITKDAAKTLHEKGYRKVGAKVKFNFGELPADMSFDDFIKTINEKFDVYEKAK